MRKLPRFFLIIFILFLFLITAAFFYGSYFVDKKLIEIKEEAKNYGVNLVIGEWSFNKFSGIKINFTKILMTNNNSWVKNLDAEFTNCDVFWNLFQPNLIQVSCNKSKLNYFPKKLLGTDIKINCKTKKINIIINRFTVYPYLLDIGDIHLFLNSNDFIQIKELNFEKNSSEERLNIKGYDQKKVSISIPLPIKIPFLDSFIPPIKITSKPWYMNLLMRTNHTLIPLFYPIIQSIGIVLLEDFISKDLVENLISTTGSQVLHQLNKITLEEKRHPFWFNFKCDRKSYNLDGKIYFLEKQKQVQGSIITSIKGKLLKTSMVDFVDDDPFLIMIKEIKSIDNIYIG